MRAKGKLVEEKRVVADKTFLWNGKRLASQTKLIDPETEKPVPSHEALEILEHYNKKYVDEEGREVSKKDVQYFEVKEDGSEVEVRPFDRTSEIRIIQEVPATSMNGMLETSVYELFHVEESIVSALYEEAERYLKEDIVGVALFSWGRGFLQRILERSSIRRILCCCVSRIEGRKIRLGLEVDSDAGDLQSSNGGSR